MNQQLSSPLVQPQFDSSLCQPPPERSQTQNFYHSHQPQDPLKNQRLRLEGAFHGTSNAPHKRMNNLNSKGESQQQVQSRNPSMNSNGANLYSGNLPVASNNSSTGIRKIDRINNQLATQSVQGASNFRSIDFNSKQADNLMPKVLRERCESVSQQTMKKMERNCKTSSPTQQFASATESRLRKKSKDIMKKENFADLIVILGIKYNEFIDQRRVIPQIVGGYPDLNNKEVAKEHNYVDNLIWICFPEGYTVQGFEKRKEGELCQMRIFHFIITNQDGLKKYITSILFKELFLSEKLGAFIVPKSICVISAKPIFSLQKQLLTLIFQKVILPYNSASIQAYTQHPANYISYLNEYTEELIKKNPDAYLMQRIEFYLTIFFNHLYYCEEVDKDIEIEEIRERSTPVAHGVDGTKKRHKHKRKVIESYFRYRNTKTYGFTLENYSFELLLQCLKPERILFLITALLLERKIILIKENSGDIALIMESLVSLLNPLQWNFVFITYLTPKLVECLEAPFPYMIGVSRKVWEDHCVMREFPDDLIIFDIDNQELLNQMREELPPLPQPQASVLQRSLKGLLDIKERFVETIQENSTHRIPKEKIDEFYWAYAQLRVKQSFFNFFLLTINNYIGYFKNLDEEGDLSPHKKDKKFYHKLSSVDVFDFDNYLNQFEGKNQDFMDKLVKTQSFNNFIEETYKNTNSKSMIGFFKTNFEVMLDHSFKKLKREQNKLLDKTFFNLQNPVKFNIGHMFKEFKRKLLVKHQSKIQNLLKEGDINNQDLSGINLDLFTRQDLLEKLLLADVEGNSKLQLSILNPMNYDLITEMPGIQYEQISTYEQRKTYRSDHSQDIRSQNKTTISRHLQNLDFQGNTTNHNETGVKSRNQSKIHQSRSGGDLSKSQSFKANPQHKRGGNVYNNYLSMADSKNAILLSQEDDIKNDRNDLANRVNNKTQQFQGNKFKQNLNINSSLADINKINDKIYSKYRVQSENSFKNGNNLQMNKTVIVNSNSHIQRPQALTSHQKLKQNQNSSSTRNNIFHSSQAYQGMNTSTANAQITQSPHIIKGNHINHQSKLSNICSNSFINDKKKNEQNKQQSVLKEALNRKIMHERSKHGLNMKSSDARMKHMSSVSNILSPSNRSYINVDETTNNLHKNSSKFIPKSNIDLMNPRHKKISRNEERKIAMKKGFLDPQLHESFSQFIYSPNEELTKLAMMQMIQRKVENGQLQIGKLKDQASFSTLMYQNYNSNGSDDDLLSKILSNNSASNQIQFQKRLLNEPLAFQANDPLSTTINFQHNFVQQKPHLHQSPTTEMSSAKKGDRLTNQDLQDDDYVVLQQQSPLGLSHVQSLIESQDGTKKHIILEGDKKKSQHHRHTKKASFNLNNSTREQSLNKVLNGLKNQIKNFDPKYNPNVDEESETIETRPLKIGLNDTINNKTKVGSKNSKRVDQGSPLGNKSEQQSNLSFKQFMTNLKNKPISQNQNNIIVRKNTVPVISSNKSPKHATKNGSKNTLQKSTQQIGSSTQTFDNTARTDSTKPSSSNILQRKRSSPAFNHEKSPPQSVSNKHNFMHANSKAVQEAQIYKSQQSFTYFKQRPVNATQQQTKSSQPNTTTFQIDLGKSQKLSHKPPSRLGKNQEMASLRISPIPNMNQILEQRHNQNHSSSGLSDDQVIIQSNENNRSSNLQSNQNDNIYAMNSNYLTRQSEKSVNQNDIMHYTSLTNTIEHDFFDKANLTIQGAQSVRNDHSLNHHKHHKHHLKNQLKNITQRSSSIVQKTMTNRVSQLSGNMFLRTSQISLGDPKKHDKEGENARQELQMMSNNSRQSELLSQNEGPSNISISILKSSPRPMSRGAQKQLAQINENKNLGSKNSVHQAATQVQKQAITSYDSSKMKGVLSAIKQKIPSSTQNQDIGIVKISLDQKSKPLFSPKQTQGNKDKLSYGKQNVLMRTSSIEQTKSYINMSSESKKYEHQLSSSNFSSTTLQKKNAQSPQPQGLTSASNTYLKALRSQEFQLKGKKQRQNMMSSNYQSTDPLVPLQKENTKSSKKSKLSSNNCSNQDLMKSKGMASSNKNLKIEVQDAQMQASYSTNSKIRSNSKQIESKISKSTKNLYGQIGKDKLLEEIKGVNETLNKIEERKQNAQKSGYNILEETLTSKSGSNASYQTSPKNIIHQGSQQIRGFKSSAIFKTVNNGDKKPSIEESQGNQIATVQNNNYPKKNFQVQEDKFPLFTKQNSEQIPIMKLDYKNLDEPIIDYPREMQSFQNYEESLQQYENTNQMIQQNRKSQIHQEIDSMMIEPPIKRESRTGYRSNKNRQSRDYESVKNPQKIESRERSEDSSKPLIEIKQHDNQIVKNQPKHNYKSSNSLMNDTSKYRTCKDKVSENSVGLILNAPLSRHSHTLSNDQLPKELGMITKQIQKKRQLRHGMTTQNAFPAKDSVLYVRRDLNQDVFCKISSHIGDIDNDPHTPKSDGSLKSQEKKNRKHLRNNFDLPQKNYGILGNIQEQPYPHQLGPSQNEYFQEIAHQSYLDIAPLRIHSSSVDSKQEIKFQSLQQEKAPQQTKMKLEVEESKNQSLKETLQSPSQFGKGIAKNMCKQNNLSGEVHEVLFEDADLKDNDDKFTSRDFNFNRLRKQSNMNYQ